MSSNAIGTVIRILIIAVGLLALWFLPIYIVVMISSYIFDFNYGLDLNLILFTTIVIYRMFFPNNVFV